jgi:hypothetical protein
MQHCMQVVAPILVSLQAIRAVALSEETLLPDYRRMRKAGNRKPCRGKVPLDVAIQVGVDPRIVVSQPRAHDWVD